jgi:hypothetical protein
MNIQISQEKGNLKKDKKICSMFFQCKYVKVVNKICMALQRTRSKLKKKVNTNLFLIHKTNCSYNAHPNFTAKQESTKNSVYILSG